MTLDTSIVIQDPTPVRPVFDHCRALLGCTRAHTWKRDESGYWGNPVLMNDGGQNLPGWLIVYYGPDGPLQRDPGYPEMPAGFIEVTLDTAYGYRGPNGEGCGDLHAWFIRELGEWLDERCVKWTWQNEFTGEWHDRYDALDEFGDANLGAL